MISFQNVFSCGQCITMFSLIPPGPPSALEWRPISRSVSTVYGLLAEQPWQKTRQQQVLQFQGRIRRQVCITPDTLRLTISLSGDNRTDRPAWLSSADQDPGTRRCSMLWADPTCRLRHWQTLLETSILGEHSWSNQMRSARMRSRKDPEGPMSCEKCAKWGQTVAKSATRFRAALEQRSLCW